VFELSPQNVPHEALLRYSGTLAAGSLVFGGLTAARISASIGTTTLLDREWAIAAIVTFAISLSASVMVLLARIERRPALVTAQVVALILATIAVGLAGG
jgi:hypothetical protein